MQHHTKTVIRRRKGRLGDLIEVPKEEPQKPKEDFNAEAMITIKMPKLPEVHITRAKNNVALPIRTPQLGFLQIIVTGRTYLKVKKQIEELPEDTKYKIIIKAPYDRLQKKCTPTCLGSNMTVVVQKSRAV